MRTLVVNAGSSSLKCSGFVAAAAGPRREWTGQIDGLGRSPHGVLRDADGATLADAAPAGDDFRWLIDALRQHRPGWHPDRIGHRVVHGGPDLTAPHAVDAALLATLEKLSPLAPLHLPANRAGIDAAAAAFPGVPAYACFDTAFHRAHPWVNDTYALPAEYHARGIRRYGFHGLSYEYIAGRLTEVSPALAAGRAVVAHLGNGASACALHAGRSIDCTMGFSPADGLPMGTRTGAIDPGVLLYLQLVEGQSAKQVLKLINQEAGLLGLSGVSSDVRDLLASDNPAAAAALDYFAHRAAVAVAGLAASMGGLDGLVFTAGIGEHAAPVRAAVLRKLAWLGFELDDAANSRHGPRLTRDGSPREAWVIPTDEEVVIARAAV